MPEFDIDAILNTDPVPYCRSCGRRTRLVDCDTGEKLAGFSLRRQCSFACQTQGCPAEGLPWHRSLVVTQVSRDLNDLGEKAVKRVSMGRCPHCLSISGPAQNHVQHPPGGLYLTWDCDDCEDHWEEHLEVADACL